MSASNWLSNEEEVSPDRNDRYRVDNVALQLRLGLPIEVIGIPPRDNGSNFSGERVLVSRQQKRNKEEEKLKSNEIKETIDGIPIHKVYITNIALDVTRKELSMIFGGYGKVINLYLSVSKNNSSKKFAFITYLDPKAATKVLTINKFYDSKYRSIYATAADSWHQPKVGENGKFKWPGKIYPKEEDGSEEDNEEEEQSLYVQVNSGTEEVDRESLNILNDDCLMHIFSFLSLHEVAKIEIVCKRWQGLSYRMWRCLHKLSYSERTFPEMKANTSTLAGYLRRCGPSLNELDLVVNNHEFGETTLAVVAKNCNNLEVLRVSNLVAGNRSLAHLGRSCSKLKQLYMNECSKFNDKDLSSILPKCHQLQVLEILYNTGLTGKFLAYVQSPLSSLHLSNLPAFDANALITGLERMSASLETLLLNACGNLNIGHMNKLVSAVPNLTSFTVCRIMSGFESTLVPISKLKKLNSINLSLNYGVDDNLLAAIVEGCKNITDINISSSGECNGLLTERGLSMLSRLRHLTHLNISYLENATDTALKGITGRSPKLRNLICRGCPDLTDEGCVQVVTVCNDLELFDVSGCCNVSEQTVFAALTSVKMRTNNVPLRLIVGGTEVRAVANDPEVPLLTVDLADLSEEHLRPDFIDEMFLAPSDSDEEEDLDHLCCDCEFDFDDLYDPTLGFVDDNNLEYGEMDEGWLLCGSP